MAWMHGKWQGEKKQGQRWPRRRKRRRRRRTRAHAQRQFVAAKREPLRLQQRLLKTVPFLALLLLWPMVWLT